MTSYNSLWVEKYRPKTLKEIVLDEDNYAFFSSLSDETPHIMLWGTPGIGKTTLAKIIVNDILKCQYLYINASDENGVDTIRNKVVSFSQIKSFDGNKKVVILDESDGLTNEGQRILRNVMEEYAENTRFILTANYFNKIIEPIRSRCLLFNLKPQIPQILERCLYILKEENIQIDEKTKNDLSFFIAKRYPDLRRIINDLQKYSIDKNFDVEDKTEFTNFVVDILRNLLKKENVLAIRKTIIEKENIFEGDYQKLLGEFFNIIYQSKLDDKKKKSVLVEIGEYMYRDNFVLDHEINFFCCLLAIENIF